MESAGLEPVQTIDYAELSRLSNELDAEKPYFELIDGIRLQKTNGRFTHGRLQLEFGAILDGWADGRGQVGVEWRFWLVPVGDRRTSLVPDVAYVSNDRLSGLEEDPREMPPFAPDIAVEIRDPDDRIRNIQRKVELYLAHGSRLVLDIDPKRRMITAYDASSSRTYREDDRFEHPAADGLTFDVGALFAVLKYAPYLPRGPRRVIDYA